MANEFWQQNCDDIQVLALAQIGIPDDDSTDEMTKEISWGTKVSLSSIAGQSARVKVSARCYLFGLGACGGAGLLLFSLLFPAGGLSNCGLGFVQGDARKKPLDYFNSGG